MYRRLTFTVILALLGACSTDTIDRTEWERMSREDRILYINSLIGAEKTKEAKGGGGKVYDAPAEEYVENVNQAYARGDQREVHEIFATLETSR